MHKGEFVTGMAVRPIGSMHVMTLGGTPDEWICSWYDNDEHRAMRYMPEDLEPVCMLVGDATEDDVDRHAMTGILLGGPWTEPSLMGELDATDAGSDARWT